MLILLSKLLLLSILIGVFIVLYHFVKPRFSRLHELRGPPSNGLFHSHLDLVLDSRKSPLEVEKLVQKYGRSFRVNGLGMVRIQAGFTTERLTYVFHDVI